jgi:hypothetical protein
VFRSLPAGRQESVPAGRLRWTSDYAPSAGYGNPAVKDRCQSIPSVSLALNQILTGEPDTSFPDELRSTLRWTSPVGRQTERNYRLPNATRDKTRRLNIATYISKRSFGKRNKSVRATQNIPFNPVIELAVQSIYGPEAKNRNPTVSCRR